MNERARGVQELRAAALISSNSSLAVTCASRMRRTAGKSPGGAAVSADGEAGMEPIHIVELGAGHGKLGFLVLTHLVCMRDSGRLRCISLRADHCCQQSRFQGTSCIAGFSTGLCDYAVRCREGHGDSPRGPGWSSRRKCCSGR